MNKGATVPTISTPNFFTLNDVPEYKRFMAANPKRVITPDQVATMYSTSIDWYAIFGIIWPDFKSIKYLSIEVKVLFINDPDKQGFPHEFYTQIANMIAMFWRIQLSDLFPDGLWKVNIWDDPEITVDAEIIKPK